jgi:hypothetical protein
VHTPDYYEPEVTYSYVMGTLTATVMTSHARDVTDASATLHTCLLFGNCLACAGGAATGHPCSQEGLYSAPGQLMHMATWVQVHSQWLLM